MRRKEQRGSPDHHGNSQGRVKGQQGAEGGASRRAGVAWMGRDDEQGNAPNTIASPRIPRRWAQVGAARVRQAWGNRSPHTPTTGWRSPAPSPQPVPVTTGPGPQGRLFCRSPPTTGQSLALSSPVHATHHSPARPTRAQQVDNPLPTAPRTVASKNRPRGGSAAGP